MVIVLTLERVYNPTRCYSVNLSCANGSWRSYLTWPPSAASIISCGHHLGMCLRLPVLKRSLLKSQQHKSHVENDHNFTVLTQQESGKEYPKFQIFSNYDLWKGDGILTCNSQQIAFHSPFSHFIVDVNCKYKERIAAGKLLMWLRTVYILYRDEFWVQGSTVLVLFTK